MVDTQSPIAVANQGVRGEDRKVDQVVCELDRYGVVVGALQETKWFGSEVYEVCGSVVPYEIAECQSSVPQFR